ncbi:hypothetical protein B0H13DRAFT_1577494, partial [Mycena leptocephala]
VTSRRRHFKRLNDGSRSSVWPEDLEEIFLLGLLTFQSAFESSFVYCSRARNQLLVDYLRDVGIHRTKKRVSSHIQVLSKLLIGHP